MEQVRQKIKMQGFKSSKKADNKSVLSQVIPVFTIPGPHMCMTVFTMETVTGNTNTNHYIHTANTE